MTTTSHNAVRERPILMSAPMVRAILDGKKTVTRRVVKITHRTPGLAAALLPPVGIEPRPRVAAELCPYGRPGDRLWVREGCLLWTRNGKPNPDVPNPVIYRDDPYFEAERSTLSAPLVVAGSHTVGWQLTSPIHMPRWASRITLEIADVRVERAQEITEEDAVAEGVGHGFVMNGGWPDYEHVEPNGHCTLTQDSARASFASLWDSINAKRGFGWDANPWVWVLGFRRVA